MAKAKQENMPRLQQEYLTKIAPALKTKFGYTSVMQVPKIVKITLNMGVGEAALDGKAINAAVSELTLIAGQKPQVINSKKAIAAFKLRKGIPIGAKVTLRQVRMYEFLDRLVNIALPRVRDFRGLSSKSFDGKGNYSIGLKEQIVFPEINYDKIEKIRGLDITIVTTAKNDAEAKELLAQFNMPFLAAGNNN